MQTCFMISEYASFSVIWHNNALMKFEIYEKTFAATAVKQAIQEDEDQDQDECLATDLSMPSDGKWMKRRYKSHFGVYHRYWQSFRFRNYV